MTLPRCSKQRCFPAVPGLVYIDATSNKAAHKPCVTPNSGREERRVYYAFTVNNLLNANGSFGTCFNKAIDDTIVPLKDSIE